jgi:hypothetical protein
MNNSIQLEAGINQTVEEIKKELETLRKLPLEEKQKKNEDMKSMIHYFVEETAKIEDRRQKISDSSWQTLGLVVTALGIIVAVSIIPLWKIPILIILSVMGIASIARVIEFEAQSRFRYPFLRFPEYSNRWKWFYYGNKYITQISQKPFGFNHTRLLADELAYIQGFKFSLENYRKETIDSEITDNFIQMYLLQVHNYYKNRFYLRLLEYNRWGQWCIAAMIVAYLVIILIGVFSAPTIMAFLFN